MICVSYFNGGEEEFIEDIGGKARRKETTGKILERIGLIWLRIGTSGWLL
jgi:hypothetical protein